MTAKGIAHDSRLTRLVPVSTAIGPTETIGAMGTSGAKAIGNVVSAIVKMASANVTATANRDD